MFTSPNGAETSEGGEDHGLSFFLSIPLVFTQKILTHVMVKGPWSQTALVSQMGRIIIPILQSSYEDSVCNVYRTLSTGLGTWKVPNEWLYIKGLPK
jgi:hypothetical protein